MARRVTMNEYAEQIDFILFMDCPKAVLVAIAVSHVINGGVISGQGYTPNEWIATSWFCLHQNGIVTQPLPALYRDLVKVRLEDRASAIGMANGTDHHHKRNRMDPKIKELTDAVCLAVSALNWMPKRNIPSAGMDSYKIVARLEKALQAVYQDVQKQEHAG